MYLTVVLPQQLLLHAEDGVDNLLLLARHDCWRVLEVANVGVLCDERMICLLLREKCCNKLAGGKNGKALAARSCS